MSELFDTYSIQHWLETAPQGYLADTEYGHAPGETEPAALLDNPELREQAIRTTVQLVIGERCALAASSGLINCTPDEASKRFLATQTLDEARHVEVFTQRLLDLGIAREDLASTIRQHVNPNLMKFAEVLLDKIHKGDFVAGVVGQNIILEGMAFSVFEMMQTIARDTNRKLARTLVGVIADERRHVGFGENTIGALVRQHPEKKHEIECMQRDMTHYMLATFADGFRDNPAASDLGRVLAARSAPEARPEWRGADLSDMEPAQMHALLANTVLADFKTRLERIGLEYRVPPRS